MLIPITMSFSSSGKISFFQSGDHRAILYTLRLSFNFSIMVEMDSLLGTQTYLLCNNVKISPSATNLCPLL